MGEKRTRAEGTRDVGIFIGSSPYTFRKKDRSCIAKNLLLRVIDSLQFRQFVAPQPRRD